MNQKLEFPWQLKLAKKSTNVRWKGCQVAPCKANVEQCSAEFVISPINHNYEPKTGVSVAAKISKEVNKRSMENVFEPASVIIEEEEHEPGTLQCSFQSGLHGPDCRQKSIPEDPKDVDFEIPEEHIPDNFLRGDVMYIDRYYLIFAKSDQLTLLAKVKKWYATYIWHVIG